MPIELVRFNGLETYLDDVGTAPISIGQGIDILDYNNSNMLT